MVASQYALPTRCENFLLGMTDNAFNQINILSILATLLVA